MNEIVDSSTDLKSRKTLTTVIYALYAASFFVAITAVVGIVMNYLKQGEMRGTFLESHFRWQMRTFWYGLLWGIVGALLLFVFVGWFVLVANAVWLIYRIVKGWLNLNDNKPMYA